MIDWFSEFSATVLAVALMGWIGLYWWNNLHDRRKLKRDMLRRVMGYRWTLTEQHLEDLAREHFFTALNEALVVFAGDERVVNELEEFHKNDFRPDSLEPLVKAMAKASNVPTDRCITRLIERPFAPRTPRSSGLKKEIAGKPTR